MAALHAEGIYLPIDGDTLHEGCRQDVVDALVEGGVFEAVLNYQIAQDADERKRNAAERKHAAKKTERAEKEKADNGDLARPVIVSMADVAAEPVHWLWDGKLPLGMLTMLSGDPGLGKSMVSLYIAACVTRGDPMHGDREAAKPGGVVLLAGEDSAQHTLRPRLDALSADCRRINIIPAVEERTKNDEYERQPIDLLYHIPAVRTAIELTDNCRLLIIDPVNYYTPATDSHKDVEVRRILTPLTSLAQELGIAVLVVNHLRKGEGAAIHRSQGSIGYAAAARVVLGLGRDPSDPALRRFGAIKNNLAPDQFGYVFSIEGDPPRAVWRDGKIEMSGDDILGQARPTGHSRQDDAADWLERLLSDGPMSVPEVEEAAKKAGHSWKTIKRAKGDLGITSFKDRFDGGWTWYPPEWEPSQGGQIHTTPEFGPLRTKPEENGNILREKPQGGQEGQVCRLAPLGDVRDTPAPAERVDPDDPDYPACLKVRLTLQQPADSAPADRVSPAPGNGDLPPDIEEMWI
jgi:hypothetical protein